jgi:hypothetical protein
MAQYSALQPAPRQEPASLNTPIRPATRRDDLEIVGLLAGVLVILFVAVVLFGVTSPAR